MKEQGIVIKRSLCPLMVCPWDSWGDENYCDTVFVIHITIKIQLHHLV